MTPCMPWSGARNDRGYPVRRVDGRTRYVHREVLAEKLGRPLATGEQARHTCDNPPCINPTHLLVGTNRDNVQDAISRGRFRGTDNLRGGRRWWPGNRHRNARGQYA